MNYDYKPCEAIATMDAIDSALNKPIGESTFALSANTLHKKAMHLIKSLDKQKAVFNLLLIVSVISFLVRLVFYNNKDLFFGCTVFGIMSAIILVSGLNDFLYSRLEGVLKLSLFVIVFMFAYMVPPVHHFFQTMFLVTPLYVLFLPFIVSFALLLIFINISTDRALLYTYKDNKEGKDKVHDAISVMREKCYELLNDEKDHLKKKRLNRYIYALNKNNFYVIEHYLNHNNRSLTYVETDKLIKDANSGYNYILEKFDNNGLSMF